MQIQVHLQVQVQVQVQEQVHVQVNGGGGKYMADFYLSLQVVKYMADFYPPDFTYQQFGPNFRAEFFNATE